MKDEFNEAAERLLGDLLNLEISLEEEGSYSDDQKRERRHALVVEFLCEEFESLSEQRERADAKARRLISVLHDSGFGPVEPNNWNVEREQRRCGIIAEFFREELDLARAPLTAKRARRPNRG